MDLNSCIPLNIVFFLLALLIVITSSQICVAPGLMKIDENNSIGDTVATITIEEGVSLSITENPQNAFGINGNLVVAEIVLDYESLPIGGGLTIGITCRKDGVDPLNIRVFVVVNNINDNPPVFASDLYTLQVQELSKVGTPVGKIDAKDLDGDRLYYQLVSPMELFALQADSNPEILVNNVLDYDTIKDVTLTLFAQDTPLSSTVTPSHTATTTITVTILDINNRPPWFQPCTVSIFGTTKICPFSGYTGNVNLNEQAADALTLNPGPVHAIDGDNGRNDTIRYRIIGDDAFIIDTFDIDKSTGLITMKKPVGIAGPIILTVMAYELQNPDQFATTTVTLQVVISSKHPPQFVKPKYEGFISEDAGVGSLVMESKSRNIPLQVQSTDADFSDGVNPDIKFEVPVDSDFQITPEGFIIMTRAASSGNIDLQISVVDKANGESSTASLSVEVTPGVTTTDIPTTTNWSTTTVMTTTMATSTTITNDTTNIDTTTVTVTQLTEVTASPHTITTNPVTTHSPYTEGLPLPSGDFRTEDMIALGASLAVALLLCFVVIGFLAYTLKRSKAARRKLSEASIFRSSLSGGSGVPKDGAQYTNDRFQADKDTDSVTSIQAAELPLQKELELSRNVQEIQRSAPRKSSNDSFTLPTDSNSETASDNTDNEKEVKPILTKERRMEEGYKAVWFKEDIDPNDKDKIEVPDRDQDNDHESDHDDDDEDEEEDSNLAEF